MAERVDTMMQLLVHFWGDYFLQSDWMALNKNKKTLPCLIHVLLYTACFLLLTTSWKALLVIGVSHFLIDRFGLAKYIIYLKNHMNPQGSYPLFGYCNTTGYFDDSPYNTYKLSENDIDTQATKHIHGEPRPFFITVWLYIIADNVLHLTFNYLALAYL